MIKMENYLKTFALNLHPSREDLRRGKAHLDLIFRTIQRNSRFSINKCELVGGAEKKTSTRQKLDFDCVVFVNNVTHKDFEQVLNDFIRVLNQQGLHITAVKKTPRGKPFTLQFTSKKKDFDIVVATGSTLSSREQAIWLLTQAQQKRTAEEGKEFMWEHSGELSEMSVEFIKKQSAFIHQFIRLCKHWRNSLKPESVSLPGLSSIIELLAIYSGSQHQEAYHGAFKAFLEAVKNIHNLEISFTGSYYTTAEIPPAIKRCPYLINPANPYQNFLEDLDSEAKTILSGFAKVTLARMERGCTTKLFETQKTV